MTTLFHFSAPVKTNRPFGQGVPETDGQAALRRAFNHMFPACSRRGRLDDVDAPTAPAPELDPWDVECDPADWPADTDEWVWEPTDPEPEFTPSPEDRSWAAREFDTAESDRLEDARFDAMAAESAVMDRLEAGLCC